MTQVEGGGLPEGTQLNGIYEIGKRIAIGGMGEVYVGRLIQTGDRVAIKMILPEHAGNELIVDLFRREASTLHNLYHEAIVRYYVFSVDPVLNRPYLTMEFAAGPSLGDRLRDGPLDEAEMTVLRRRVAGGLNAAHKLGIVHRDISPDNIILVDGQVEKAKIIDFGIAKSSASEGTLIGSGFAGKLNYVSPEQLGLAGGEVTPKSDIYSLGLVFAQATTGKALPMGGTQVEVIEKRRVVPDLTGVPGWIMPLIESMVQPNPADRPADMQEVAEWEPAGSSPAAAPARAGKGAPVHPRDRRRLQQAEADRKKGAPWLAIGLVGALAGAAVATVLIFGPVRNHIIGAGDTTASLDEPAITVAAPPAIVGVPYDELLPPFDLAGGIAGLKLRVERGLPPGLNADVNAAGRARISGTPRQAGAFHFDILASVPGGHSAWHEVDIVVAEAPRTQADGSTGQPAEDAAGNGAGNGAGQLAYSTQPASGATSGTGPLVATGGPGDLTAPATNGEAAVGAGASDDTPPVTQSQLSSLGGQAGAGGLPVIPASDDEPVTTSTGPQVTTDHPGTLGSVTPPDEGSGIKAGTAGGAASITHAGPPQPPVGGKPDDGVIAAIPPPQNQPPTLLDPVDGKLEAVQGQAVNVRLGTVEDDEGPAGLRLDVRGSVPAGVGVRLGEGGVLQLYGTPAEFGDFDLRIAAIDPQGLVSRPVAVMLSVAPPAANRTVRDYILGYDGGDCFLSRPVELGPKLARIEVFAPESRIQPVLDFDAAFKRDMGFEANIGMRPISEPQCSLIHELDRVAPQALDNSLVIALERDELPSGSVLSGIVKGGEGARLYLLDHAGELTDLSEFLEARDGGAAFSFPISAKGPQILIAAKPREGAGLAPAAGLDQLLGAAQRGQAALALGFFLLKG